MIAIEGENYFNYSIKLEYEFRVEYYQRHYEWENLPNKKLIIITPIFLITTHKDSALYITLNKYAVSMCSGNAKCFDFFFDDKINKYDGGNVNIKDALIIGSSIDSKNKVTFKIISNYCYNLDGFSEFISYIGSFDVPLTLNGNYIEYIKKHYIEPHNTNNMEETDIKEFFLNKLKENYKSLKWTREEQEVKSSFGKYDIKLVSNRDGEFLQVMPKGDFFGKTIDSKDYPLVSEIKHEIWGMISKEQEDSFWNEVTDVFSTLCCDPT